MPLQNDPIHDSLEVQVTEPAIFLRVSERQCRRYYAPTVEGGPSSGALIRGVLTLTLANAVPISSIEVELEGRAATTWVEGMQFSKTANVWGTLLADHDSFRGSVALGFVSSPIYGCRCGP